MGLLRTWDALLALIKVPLVTAVAAHKEDTPASHQPPKTMEQWRQEKQRQGRQVHHIPDSVKLVKSWIHGVLVWVGAELREYGSHLTKVMGRGAGDEVL